MSAQESPRDVIVRITSEKGISWRWLSLEVGKNDAYFQQFIKRGKPKNLPETVRKKAARILGVDESNLGAAHGSGAEPPQNAKIIGQVSLKATIPAYGHAVGGKDGEFVLNGNKVADLLAPASLAAVPDAYAVYVAGDSMLDRYAPGEAVYVNPRLPIRKYDYVVAQIRGRESEGEAPLAYVKRFLSVDSKTLRLEQLNPKKILNFPARSVVSIHRIVLSGEG